MKQTIKKMLVTGAISGLLSLSAVSAYTHLITVGNQTTVPGHMLMIIINCIKAGYSLQTATTIWICPQVS